MVTLWHTSSLHVPYDQRVGSVSRRSTHHGETVSAQLTINGLIVGLIENDGNGGRTELYSPNYLFGWQRTRASRTAELLRVIDTITRHAGTVRQVFTAEPDQPAASLSALDELRAAGARVDALIAVRNAQLGHLDRLLRLWQLRLNNPDEPELGSQR